MNEEEELLAKLGDAIGPVEADPPAERISAVRAAADAARTRSLGAVPLADRPADRVVDPRPISRPRRQFLTGIAAAAAGLAGGAALWEASDDDP
ncbi:MAG: twin-arginine translocation signal domain-containing protein, partial [Acidimicrobiia bacterium]|nr:twin-arginine translocation signal domain-containing protein [Acidimicrobiia bacterium]